MLGAPALNKLHAPGNGAFDDTLLRREQLVGWMARKSGIPWLHRRFFHFYVNGVKKRTLMEDTQVGSDDLVEEFWPDDAAGNLDKLQPWFEFPDATGQNLQMQSSTFVSLARFTTTGGQLKLARYRWNGLVRGAEGTANDYTNVLQFINVATDYAHPAYASNVAVSIPGAGAPPAWTGAATRSIRATPSPILGTAACLPTPISGSAGSIATRNCGRPPTAPPT